MSNIWLSQNVITLPWFKNAVKLRIADQSLQLLNNSILSSSKGLMYECMKSCYDISLLQSRLGTKCCNTPIKFRTANHKLPTETGRWKNISSKERFCPLCPSEIGDEFHYLFHCTKFTDSRKICLKKYFINNPNYHKMSTLFLTSNVKQLRNLCKFVSTICLPI